jgi:hypothetical protein
MQGGRKWRKHVEIEEEEETVAQIEQLFIRSSLEKEIF